MLLSKHALASVQRSAVPTAHDIVSEDMAEERYGKIVLFSSGGCILKLPTNELACIYTDR